MIGKAANLNFGISVFYSISWKNEPLYLAASFEYNFRYPVIAMLK